MLIVEEDRLLEKC